MNGQEEKGPSEKMKKGRQERKEGNKTSVVSLNPRKEYLDKKSCVIKTDWCLLELAAKEIVCVCVCVCVCVSHSVRSDSLRPHGQQPSRLFCPWDSPGRNTGVGCHFLLQKRW